MSKHTPAPWRVNFKKFSEIKAENGALIATANNLNGLENLQANARLIAAAPELLKALKETTAALKAAWDSRILPADAISGEIVRQNIAAIAKAEVQS